MRVPLAQVGADASLWGNRLAASAAGDERLLVAHPEGAAGERLVLSELRMGRGGRWQARAHAVALRPPVMASGCVEMLNQTLGVCCFPSCLQFSDASAHSFSDVQTCCYGMLSLRAREGIPSACDPTESV